MKKIAYSESCIRPIEPADIPAVLDIYRPYILNTTITFEYTVPSVEEFAGRVKEITAQFPWLVCENKDSGELLGYAYASSYHTRAAYQWGCELSVYLKESTQGDGLGGQLYRELIRLVTEMGYYNAYALICYPNEKSMRLHENLGFVPEGIQQKVGFKHGQWLDLITLKKSLRELDCPTAAPLRFSELPEAQALNRPQASASLTIRALEAGDAVEFETAFAAQGWSKSREQFEQYLAEQEKGTRCVFVAVLDGTPAGYVTLLPQAHAGPFAGKGIPEIVDFNVLERFQKHGIGKALMDAAEQTAGETSGQVCLGVGLHQGYGSAQRMYVKRGFVFDGSGVWYLDKNLAQNAECINDDDLVLYLKKNL